MLFSKTTLSNGLRLITVPMPSMQSATVQILVKAGSRNETPKTQGVAHFLEHMVFKGTKKYPTAQTISLLVDSIGADINAGTSKERTAYYIKAWDRYLNLSFDILSGFVKNPLLQETEIEKEKGVIIEEIAMYNDLPMQKAPTAFEELVFKGSSLAPDIAGTKETVTKMQRKNFTGFMGEYYNPANMVLTVAGKFEPKEVLKMAEEYFGEGTGQQVSGSDSSASQWISKSVNQNGRNTETLTDRKTEVPSYQIPRNSFPVNPNKKPQYVVVNKKTEQAHIVLGVMANPIGHPDQYKESVLNAILGGGMSSRMWNEVREKRGLAYYVRTYFDKNIDCGYFAVRAGIKTDQVDEAIKVILEQMKNMASNGAERITDEELAKAKEHLKGSLALDLEDTHSVAEFVGNQELFRDHIRTLEEIMQGIDGVTIEDVRGLAKGLFVDEKLNLAVVGPTKKNHNFEKLLRF